MIKKKTTFVLGAGASMAYGFPSGSTLKGLIWKKLNRKDHPPYFCEAADKNYRVNKGHLSDMIDKFCKNIILSPDETIDYFLEHVGDDEDEKNNYRWIGRLTIADILLEREQKTFLFDDWMEYNALEKNYQRAEFLKNKRIRPDDGHWYQFLFNQMCRECPSIDNFPDNDISVITFNYDRSFEYYFLCALMAKYKVDVHKAAEILNQFGIVHVYGQLGELHGLVPEGEIERRQKSVRYTAFSEPENRAPSLENAANGIQLIWDNQGETKNTKAAQDLIDRPKNHIVFLGFGYDPINLQRIMPNRRIASTVGMEVYGTILGLSKQRLISLEREYSVYDAPDDSSLPKMRDESLFHIRENARFPGNCKIYEFLFNSTEIFG